MEAKNRGIAKVRHTSALDGNAKGMGRIINDLQVIFPGDPFDLPCPAHISVHMHRQDGRGPGCDQLLQPIRVQSKILDVDITEHRSKSPSYDCMSGGGKGKGSGDHFPA